MTLDEHICRQRSREFLRRRQRTGKIKQDLEDCGDVIFSCKATRRNDMLHAEYELENAKNYKT